MRPLSGIIIRSGDTTVRIRLSTGGIITAPTRPGLNRGTKVEVDYDRTCNEMHAVWLEGERKMGDEPISEPTDLDLGEETNRGSDSRTFTSPTFEGSKGKEKGAQDLHEPEP